MSKNEHLGLTRLAEGELVVKQEDLDKLLLNWAVSTIKRLDSTDSKPTATSLFKNGAKKIIESALGSSDEPNNTLSSEYLTKPVELSVINIDLSIDNQNLDRVWVIGKLALRHSKVHYLLGSLATKLKSAIKEDSEQTSEELTTDCTGMFITNLPHLANNSAVRDYYTQVITNPQKRPF